MIKLDEDALICDLAETYHVLDYRSLPANRVATLAAGLRENSRIKMKAAGLPYPIETLLMAIAVDRLSLILWTKTKDGAKNKNRPESFYERLLGRAEKHENNDVCAFENGEEFEKKREELIKRGGDACRPR